MKAINFYAEKAELYRLIQNDFLLDALLKNFRLNLKSIHGITHWLRVLKNGLYIAKFCQANTEAVKLFAIFHDCMRKNEEYDEAHGAAGAAAARKMRDIGMYQLDEEVFKKLYYSCKYHTDGQVTSDPTVGTCWDADRLDLPRVGTIPGKKWISTITARNAIEADDYSLWKRMD